MNIWKQLKKLADNKHNFRSEVQKTEEHYYWDGKYVHFGLAAGQSSSYASVACGIILSTWSGPNRRKGPTMEDELGYSWNIEPVDCPECKVWMETNLKKCDKGCGKLVVYTTCIQCIMAGK